MRRAAGQVARAVALVVAWIVHHLAQAALAIVVLVAVGAGALAWRLSEGPLQIGWLARRIEHMANADPAAARIAVGETALAWRGWRDGISQPLSIHVLNISATAPDGTALGHVDAADVTLSPGWLLIGRIVPRSIDLRGAQVELERKPDGTIAIAHAPPLADAASAAPSSDKPDVSSVMTETAKPPQTDRDVNAAQPSSAWSQIRRLRIHDASLALADRKLGFDIAVPHLEVDLRRLAQGGVEGDADIRAVLGSETLHLAAQAVPAKPSGDTALALQLDSVDPAALGRAAPALAAIAPLDAPVALTAAVTLDAGLRPRRASLHATMGAGKARLGDGVLPFLDGELEASLTDAGDVDARLLKLELAARPDAPKTTVTATLSARRAEGHKFAADVVVNLDRVSFADLPALWPAGLGGNGTRPWIAKNITAGTAHDLHVKASLAAPADLSDVNLASISGGLDGSDLTVSWLRPVPAIEHGEAHLAFADPDTINIAVTAGHQIVAGTPGISVKGGNVKLSGLEGRHQFADIDADLAGGLAELLTLLKNPRIKLLDKRKIEMRDPSGKFAGHLTVGHLPLENNVSVDDLQIKSKTHLTDAHLGGVAGGKDLDRGVLDLDASNDGLHVQGNADIASVPVDLVVDMDFRAGPPSQTLIKVATSGSADEKQMAAAGFDAGGMIAGPVSFQFTYDSRRDGGGDATLHADLSRASVTADGAGYRKAANAPAAGDVSLVLDHDRIVRIDKLHLAGDGILIDGAGDAADGKPNVFRLATIRIGATTDAHGEIRLPANPNDGYGLTLAGASLDLSDFLKRKPQSGASKPGDDRLGDDKSGPKYNADVKVDRVVLGPGRELRKVVAVVDNDGRIIRRADISGAAGEERFKFSIKPSSGGRALSGDVADLGSLLRAADITGDLVGGRLVVEGRYDDRNAAHVLSAHADLDDFSVRGAASLGKVLQAMSLYGVVDALSGPGLNFTRMIAPFEYSRGLLTVDDMRAFSSSLGMTAKGRVDLDRRMIDVEGTVVPAYFFNSLLGKLPLVGTMFSPERGGGVFSATYSVRGPFDDPSVTMNPLAALTPGFLRGIFGVFDDKGPK